MTEKDKKHISKFLSFVLRHQPQLIGLTLNENGWANVEELIKGSATKEVYFTKEELEEIVATNSKKRFAFNNSKDCIRANQGHSIAINLELTPQQPPALLYHGTIATFIDSIKANGLQKMERHHVHLSATVATAEQVGGRRGKPVILTILSEQMQNDGYVFYQSENEVWLTDEVPPQYITQ